MLYIFYGSDEQKARTKVQGTTTSLLKREPDASHVRFDSETFTQEILSEYLGERGLFAARVLVILDHIFEDKEKAKEFLQQAKEVASSDNIFILLEGKLDKKTVTKLEKQAEKIQEFSLPKSTSRTFGTERGSRDLKDFNIFSLTDALGNRDRKKLWVLYQQALRADYPPEEMHGLLFWQTKTMLLVEQKATKGIKPFVVGKAKRFLSNWTGDELKNLSSKLMNIYHAARRGGTELNVALEQLVLEL